jgi:hypothetical protein
VDEPTTLLVEEEVAALPVADPNAELPPRGEGPGGPSPVMWVATVAAVVVPVLGLGGLAVFLWGWGFRWLDLWLLLGMYLATALGITVGFHRLFTHRSFETAGTVKVVLGALGSMAVQGSLLDWVALHQRHPPCSTTLTGGILNRQAGSFQLPSPGWSPRAAAPRQPSGASVRTASAHVSRRHLAARRLG